MAVSIDFESVQDFVVNITVEDLDFTVFTLRTVSVGNINDNPPSIMIPPSLSITENNAIGDPVYIIPGRFDAFVGGADLDGDPLTFGLMSPSSYVEVNATTGAITMKTTVDFESITSFTFDASVSDPTFTVDQTVTVSVENVNDNPPILSVPATLTISESSTIGASVLDGAGGSPAAAQATDADNDILAFDLNITDPYFEVDSATGSIITAGLLDFETFTEYTINITVFDGLFWDSLERTITIINENDEDIEWAGPFRAGYIDENPNNNDPVVFDDDRGSSFFVNVTNPDGDSFPVTLSLDNATTYFTLTSSGFLQARSGIDFELTPVIYVDIKATDQVFTIHRVVPVYIGDLNDNPPSLVPASWAGAYGVDENAVQGTPLTTMLGTPLVIQATDPDDVSLPNLRFELEDNTTFAIGSISGAVTVNDNALLDYEERTTLSFRVRVSDGLAVSSYSTISIDIHPLNDNVPRFTVPLPLGIVENSPYPTDVSFVDDGELSTVATITATDDDGDPVTIVMERGGDVFSFNSTSGTLTSLQVATFDRESTSTINLRFRATANGDSTLLDIAVRVIDENDNPPVWVTDFDGVGSIAENAVAGAPVIDWVNKPMVFRASDADSSDFPVTYSLNETTNFVIDAVTGALTRSGTGVIDADAPPTSESFFVFASDGITTITNRYTLTYTDVNDNAPVIAPVSGTYSIPESATFITNVREVGTLEQLQITATDIDSVSTGKIRFSVIGDDTFRIVDTNGLVSVNNTAKIDYETSTSLPLTVRASDGQLFSDYTLTIQVENVNDNKPEFVSTHFDSLFIDENAAASTAVRTGAAPAAAAFVATVTDADNSPAFKMTFSLLLGGDVFSINGSSGALTVKTPALLNAQLYAYHQIHIQVDDPPFKETTPILNVTLLDTNDKFPIWDLDSLKDLRVAEFASAGSNILYPNDSSVFVSAADPDENAVVYSVASGGSFVQVNAITGALRLASSFSPDFSINPEFSFQLRAFDGAQATLSPVVWVRVVNINNHAPFIFPEVLHFVVPETPCSACTISKQGVPICSDGTLLPPSSDGILPSMIAGEWVRLGTNYSDTYDSMGGFYVHDEDLMPPWLNGSLLSPSYLLPGSQLPALNETLNSSFSRLTVTADAGWAPVSYSMDGSVLIRSGALDAEGPAINISLTVSDGKHAMLELLVPVEVLDRDDTACIALIPDDQFPLQGLVQTNEGLQSNSAVRGPKWFYFDQDGEAASFALVHQDISCPCDDWVYTRVSTDPLEGGVDISSCAQFDYIQPRVVGTKSEDLCLLGRKGSDSCQHFTNLTEWDDCIGRSVTANSFILQARDVNDPPRLQPKVFNVSEDIAPQDGPRSIGVLEAVDEDQCQNLTYTLFGDFAQFFDVVPLVEQVSNGCPTSLTRSAEVFLLSAVLDYETSAPIGHMFSIGVRVEDDGFVQDSSAGYVQTVTAVDQTGPNLKISVAIEDVPDDPLIDTVVTASPFGLTTAGGEEVQLYGSFLGPSERLTPLVPDSVFLPRAQYMNTENGQVLNASSCTVFAEYSVISCKSVPGVGREFTWRVIVGGQVSPWSSNRTSYAAPTVSGFSPGDDGAGDIAAITPGGEVVVIR
ncbi:CDH23 [Symbiodinium sp. KB8]|nr:CDH23 [Symbiodinium sp. KB8]